MSGLSKKHSDLRHEGHDRNHDRRVQNPVVLPLYGSNSKVFRRRRGGAGEKRTTNSFQVSSVSIIYMIKVSKSKKKINIFNNKKDCTVP